MACNRCQCKQQGRVASGVKHPTPVSTQCHRPGVVQYVSHPPCPPAGPKLYAVRKTMQSSPKCCPQCSPQCVETHLVEGHTSPCSPRSPHPCVTVFPQPHGQVRGQLCVPYCGQQSPRRCLQVCAPANLYQHSSCPYSYQWSSSYHYNCGQH